MNKNNGIWLAIAGILVVGIVLTLSTNKFVTKQEQTMAAVALETSKAAAAEKERTQTEVKTKESVEATLTERAAKDEDLKDTQALLTQSETAAAQSAADQVPAAAPAQVMAGDGAAVAPLAEAGAETTVEETVISPLKSANKAAEQKADPNALGDYYKKRLDELDAQVMKMKDSDTEGTTYSMLANAEKEWKLWDSELNTVYNEILDLLDEQDASQLVDEEKQWLKMRDAAALEASQKYSGGSLEGLEYTSTLASYTRDRVYDLVNTYLAD